MVDLVLLQSMSYIAGALGVCVAAAYYAFTLRINTKNQELSLKTQELALKAQQQNLETRQAQLFISVFSRYYEEEFWRNWYAYMSSDWKSYEDWEKDRSDIKKVSSWMSVGTYLEGVGVLVKRGLLTPDIVADILGSTVVRYWDKVAVFAREYRVRHDHPEYLEYVEFLAGEIMRLRGPDYSPKFTPVMDARRVKGSSD